MEKTDKEMIRKPKFIVPQIVIKIKIRALKIYFLNYNCTIYLIVFKHISRVPTLFVVLYMLKIV